MTSRSTSALQVAGTYQGTPCQRGHSGLRYECDGRCIECARERVRGRERKPQERRRRPLELIAIVSQADESSQVTVAATISTPDGLRREVFSADETPAGLIAALREVIDWLERDFVEISKLHHTTGEFEQ